jgi:DeoR/GlpR family transcriptional regulator of sugar metabolism
MTRESARIAVQGVAEAAGLSQSTMNRYIRVLEKKGVVRLKRGYASLTPAFEDLYVISMEFLRSWYTPSIIDEPETLVAQEMARLLLDADASKIERGLVRREDVSKLAAFLSGFLRENFQRDGDSRLTELLLL